MVQDLNIIHSQLDRITFNGSSIPKKIEEISELADQFNSFDDLIFDIKSGFWQIMLPDHHLHENYDLVTSKSIQKVDSWISLGLLIIPILLTIYGVFSGNYLLLLSLGVSFFINYLKGCLNALLGYAILLLVSVLGFINDNISLGLLFGLGLITLLASQYIRNHRRKYTIYNAMNDEYIFCSLFFSNTISLYSQLEDRFIRYDKLKRNENN